MPTFSFRDAFEFMPRAMEEKHQAAKKSASRLMEAFQNLPEPKVEDDPEELKRRMREYLSKHV